MGDKGGKSALKSPVANGDSSAKSAKGKKVQFDAEGGKGEKTANGGKGGKTANGSKKSTETPSGGKLEQELPSSSVCLMDCEAADIMQGIQDHMVILSQDPDIKLPVSFGVGLTFAKRGGNFAKPQTLKKIFEPLKKHGVSECEICLIANVCPDTVDEAFALVPALKPKMNKIKVPLKIALDELVNLKEALANLKDSA